jgi:hypothetical protein
MPPPVLRSVEAFGFLGFDLRRVHKRKKDGYTIQMTPKKKARKVVKAKMRDIIRSGGATRRRHKAVEFLYYARCGVDAGKAAS